MSKWIKKDDKVVVIAGNDKGAVGTVISRKGDKVIVQGINVRKKHIKSKREGQPSQILQIERPIHISNVAFCDGDGKAVKVRSRIIDGKKELVIRGDEEKVLRTLKK